MQRLYERDKIDIGLVPQTINNSNATGRYHSAKDYRRAIGILQIGALAATKTAKLEIFEAKDASGTAAQLLAGAAATIAANTLVTELTIALATFLAGSTIIINGLTFTAHATTTTVATRTFSIAGTDTQDGDELATCINDATFGVPGVAATNNAGTVTLSSTDAGATLITASSAGAATIATTQAEAYVEVVGLALDAGFTHIACKVTSTGNGTCAAILKRGDPRAAVTQQMAASAVV